MTSKGSRETNQFLMVKRYLEENFEFRYNTISNSVEVRIKSHKDADFSICNDSDVYCKLKKKAIKFHNQTLKLSLAHISLKSTILLKSILKR
jgi:hypothetical protein